MDNFIKLFMGLFALYLVLSFARLFISTHTGFIIGIILLLFVYMTLKKR